MYFQIISGKPSKQNHKRFEFRQLIYDIYCKYNLHTTSSCARKNQKQTMIKIYWMTRFVVLIETQSLRKRSGTKQ